MSPSLCIAFVFVFFWGAVCQTHGSFDDGLQCHRLVPSTATYWFNPCRYPCMVEQLHESYKVLMQPEPDGTLCMHVGRCSGGICLDIGNKVALETLNWDPSFEMKGYRNSNYVIRNTYGTDTYVIGSGRYSRTGFLPETNAIRYANQDENVIGEVYNTSPYSQKKGTLSVLRRLLREKRSPRVNRRYNRRRNVRNNRLTGSSISQGDRFQHHDSTWQRQSVTHSPQYGPYHPTVIILNQGKKKRSRLGSTLGTAAVGAVAGAAAGAGAVAAATHFSKRNEKEPRGVTEEEKIVSNMTNKDKGEGKKHETVGKAEGKASTEGEVDGGSEKKKPSATDGNANTESNDIGVTENEIDIGTRNKMSAGDKGSETDLANKEKQSKSEMLKEGKTEDDLRNRGTSEHDHNKSEKNKITEVTETGGKVSDGKDVAEKKKKDEDDRSDNSTDKISTTEGATTNAPRKPGDTNTHETEETYVPKEKKKRKGLFGRLLKKIFQ